MKRIPLRYFHWEGLQYKTGRHGTWAEVENYSYNKKWWHFYIVVSPLNKIRSKQGYFSELKAKEACEKFQKENPIRFLSRKGE